MNVDPDFYTILCLHAGEGKPLDEAAMQIYGRKPSAREMVDLRAVIATACNNAKYLKHYHAQPMQVYRATITQELIISAKNKKEAERTLQDCDWGDPEKKIDIKEVTASKELSEEELACLPISKHADDERAVYQILEDQKK